MPLQGFGDQCNDFGIGEHAEFDGVYIEVREAGVDLCCDKFQWRYMHCIHPAGVLRS